MEDCKISIEDLVQIFGKAPQGTYCLIELPEKKMVNFHDLGDGSFFVDFFKGIFVSYDRSRSCLVAFLEDMYPGEKSGKKNKATSFFMTCEFFNSFYKKLVLENAESLNIVYHDPFKSNNVVYNGKAYL